MRAAILLIALVTVAVAVGSVGAATTANPKDMLLRSSDMPSGAKRVKFGATSGTIRVPKLIHGKAAYVGYRFKNGRSTELIADAAGVVTSGDAHAAFLNLKKKLTSNSGLKRIALPKYGDEQVGLGVGALGASAAVVLVRKGSSIWELVVVGYPSFSKAKAKSELEKYASKAASHVG